MSAPNSLPEILDRLALPPDARVLDIGGAAFGGEESTVYLVDRFRTRIDVVAPREDQAGEMAGRFGKRIRLLAAEGEAQSGVYDLVIISPVLGKLVETLRDACWRGARLVRPGGVLLSFGMDPAALTSTAYKQPEPEIVEAFHNAFGGRSGEAISLPAWFAETWDLVENTPRKPAFRSYLTWAVLRRRADAGKGSILEGMGAASADAANGLLLTQDVDTLLVFPSVRREAERTRRITETLQTLGRRVLSVEIGTGRSGAGQDGPVLVLPRVRDEIERRLRLLGTAAGTQDNEILAEQALAAELGGALGPLARPGLVVVSQGRVCRQIVGGALDRLKLRDPRKAALVGWIHDLLDPREDDPDAGIGKASSRRPDVSIASSRAAANGLAVEPVYDAEPISDRFSYRGKKLLDRSEFKGKIWVLAGDAEGCDFDRLLGPFAAGSEESLVVATGRSTPRTARLRKQVEAEGLRVTVLAGLKPGDFPGLSADAEGGLIGVDGEGRPEPGELARLSIYAVAGIPVVAPAGGEAASVLAEWPIGRIYDPRKPASLAAAMAEVSANRQGFVDAIPGRPDLQLRFAWESQAATLRQILERIAAPDRSDGSRAA